MDTLTDPQDRQFNTDYDLLIAQAEALVEGVPHLTANLANISALIYESMEGLNWVGFYLTGPDPAQKSCPDKNTEDTQILVLGPFQGRPACIEIPYGQGVCGTAAAEDKTQLVYDVHQFEGHIACDSASNSEIVVPIHDAGGRVAGVLDIDSPYIGRFTEEDRAGLEALARLIEREVFA